MDESSYRDTLCTVDKHGNRRWVYASVLEGAFRRYRRVVAYLLIAIYVITPWVMVGGKQAVLLDIPGRKFTILGTTFWATESYYLFLVLGGLAFSLFFFTAIFGRVWCGWACPETVFVEFLFRPIEIWIEGSPTQRKRRDEGPKNLEWFRKKAQKWFVFTILAWGLATTFTAYFLGSHRLVAMILEGPSAHLSTFLPTMAMLALILFQFGWFREQFCTVLCPYARFQSVLLDEHSLVVGYDPVRGEPRGKPERGVAEKTKGDCVDCGLCVRVCPTGIDIRNGLQLECIHCASCIDACDSVMVQLGRPTGLIRYDTEKGLLSGASKLLRPRTVLYGVVLLVYAVAMTLLLLSRETSSSKITRGGQDVPFTILPDGRISNHLHARVENKSDSVRHFEYQVDGEPKVELVVPGQPFLVAPSQKVTIPLFFNFPAELLSQGKHELEVIVKDDHGFHQKEQITLFGPER